MESSIGVFVQYPEGAAGHAKSAAATTLPHSTHSITAHILGSGIAGGLELLCFHPVDTIAKRLMAHEHRIFTRSQPMSASIASLSRVIFRDAYGGTFRTRFTSLFPGLSFAFAYKVLQRIYKFGGQAKIKDHLHHTYSPILRKRFGDKNTKLGLEAVSGALIGIGEVMLLPFDILKIKSQVNPGALEGRSAWSIIRSEMGGLYRGAGVTACRNSLGSLGLFGGSAIAKEFIFHLEDYRQASVFQILISSCVGATCCLVLSNPFDVIKTRVQSKDFEIPTSARSELRSLLANEGPFAFLRGITPKLLTVGPKLVFSFTVAQYLVRKLDEMF